jgi:hypothetical protein
MVISVSLSAYVRLTLGNTSMLVRSSARPPRFYPSVQKLDDRLVPALSLDYFSPLDHVANVDVVTNNDQGWRVSTEGRDPVETPAISDWFKESLESEYKYDGGYDITYAPAPPTNNTECLFEKGHAARFFDGR